VSVLAEVPGRVWLLSAAILVYAALLGLWPVWITPGLHLLCGMLLLPLFAVLCIALLVMLINLLFDWHERIARHAWLAPLSLMVAMALALPAMWAAQYARDLVLFSLVQDWTKKRVEQSLLYATDGPFGIPVIVEPGPPVRIAFMTDPGFLDNWSGIVFDPTGAVMQADGWDATGKFRAPASITELFGGDIVSCRHLSGDYYHCSFT
jgi:hypothetical protein